MQTDYLKSSVGSLSTRTRKQYGSIVQVADKTAPRIYESILGAIALRHSLESVQRRVTRMIPGMMDLEYEENFESHPSIHRLRNTSPRGTPVGTPPSLHDVDVGLQFLLVGEILYQVGWLKVFCKNVH